MSPGVGLRPPREKDDEGRDIDDQIAHAIAAVR